MGVRCLQTARPLWPARLSQPAAFTLSYLLGRGTHIEHSAWYHKVLSIFPLSNWGQPSDKQQVGKDKDDPCRKTDTKGTDKILKSSNSAGSQSITIGDFIQCFRHCKCEKQKYKELPNKGESLFVEKGSESVKKTMLTEMARHRVLKPSYQS